MTNYCVILLILLKGSAIILWNRIYNLDVLEGLQKLVDNNFKFDLIITSPPYNIKDFHSNHIKYDNYRGNDMNEVKYQKWQLEVLELLYTLLSDEGSLFYNHKNRISNGKTITPYEWLLQTQFILKQEITWNQKKGANVDKIRCFPFSEKIYWMTKSKDVKMYNRLNLKDVWEVVPKLTRKQSGHPAVMPIEVVSNIYDIMEDTFRSKEVIRVLDPFAGVGSTFIPILDNERYRYIGIEIDSAFIDIFENDKNDRIKKYRQIK